MSDWLEKIVANKRAEIAAAKNARPVEVVKAMAMDTPRPRNFFRAMSVETTDGSENDAECHADAKRFANTANAADNGDVADGEGVADGEAISIEPISIKPRVIAEVKKASPSAGLIRDDFDPVVLAKAYEAGGAAAISCLTDEKYFQGSLDYIAQIKAAVELPILRKDFIVDTYQIYEARAAGADAVLLIAECIPNDADLIDLMILATELNLTTLLEVHTVDNLLRVRPHMGFPQPQYNLLGINNRNLTTMQTDIAHTLRLSELVENLDVLVSESGIRTNDDIKRLAAAGIHRVLVGEHLMRQPDVTRALRDLIG